MQLGQKSELNHHLTMVSSDNQQFKYRVSFPIVVDGCLLLFSDVMSYRRSDALK